MKKDLFQGIMPVHRTLAHTVNANARRCERLPGPHGGGPFGQPEPGTVADPRAQRSPYYTLPQVALRLAAGTIHAL
jgi:hypothetical protein